MEHISHPWLAHPRNMACPFPSIYLSCCEHISCLIRHSRIYPTQTRSILSTRLACTYQRCCLTSAHRFHMGTKYTPPGNNNPMSLIYYSAYSFTRPIHVSRLQMRSCIRGYQVMRHSSFRGLLFWAMICQH